MISLFVENTILFLTSRHLRQQDVERTNPDRGAAQGTRLFSLVVRQKKKTDKSPEDTNLCGARPKPDFRS